MRLDKFLKVSRIVKRRVIAKEIADNDRVSINGNPGKSSSIVKVGDVLEIKFGNKKLTIQVKQILDSTKKDDAFMMYEVLKEE